LGNPLYIIRQPPREPALKQPLGIAIGERADIIGKFSPS
jgi:hypothetical protein